MIMLMICLTFSVYLCVDLLPLMPSLYASPLYLLFPPHRWCDLHLHGQGLASVAQDFHLVVQPHRSGVDDLNHRRAFAILRSIDGRRGTRHMAAAKFPRRRC